MGSGELARELKYSCHSWCEIVVCSAACHTPKPDLPSTKVHSEMPLAYDMAGDLTIYHLTACSVAYTLQSSMH